MSQIRWPEFPEFRGQNFRSPHRRLDAIDKRFDRIEADLEHRTATILAMIQDESRETRRYMKALSETLDAKIGLAIESAQANHKTVMQRVDDLESRHDARFTALEQRVGALERDRKRPEGS